MADLSPFRTVVDLNAPPATIELRTPLIDLTAEFWGLSDSGWGQSCSPSEWDGTHYIEWSIRSVEHSWDGDPQWSTSGGLIDAAPGVLPDISDVLAWDAGAFAFSYKLSPPFASLSAYASRLVPMAGDPVEGNENFTQGSTIVLRVWGHVGTGPRQCIAGRTHPLIAESGRLEIANPPETRDDVTVYPGAVQLTFTDQPVGGVTYEPIGIRVEWVATSNARWLGREQPRLRVLYRVKR